MKKTLEDELMSLAHRVLQLRGRADVDELKTVTGELYEKLAVLSFTEKYFDGPQPTIGRKEVEKALKEKKAPKPEKETEASAASRTEGESAVSTGNDNSGQEEAKTSPETRETSKDPEKPVEQVPSPPEERKPSEAKPEQAKTEEAKPEKEAPSGNLKDMAVHFDDLPQFEPVARNPRPPRPENDKEEKPAGSQDKFPESSAAPKDASKPEDTSTSEDVSTSEDTSKKHTEKPERNLFSPTRETPRKNDVGRHKKSLNESLHHGLNFGLNDRLAFIKHLFEGSAADFDRVISQLNTVRDFTEAKSFLEEQVKPDYNWDNEEEFETRFLSALEKRMK